MKYFNRKLAIFPCLLCFSLNSYSKVGDSLLNVNTRAPVRAIQSQDFEPDVGDGYVIVEPLNVMPKKNSGDYILVPYKNRRPKWGSSFSIGLSEYSPINYESDFSANTFEELYGEPTIPSIELQYIKKRNFSVFSTGLEIAVSNVSAKGTDSAGDEHSLSLNFIRLGLIIELSALTDEPIVVPYISGGGYVVFIDENLGEQNLNGNTTVASYYGAGVKFQLNWIDPQSARIAFEDAGVQNTFAYVEARQYMPSSTEQDKLFDTDPFLSGGLNFEF